jgi:hypothetical protein
MLPKYITYAGNRWASKRRIGFCPPAPPAYLPNTHLHDFAVMPVMSVPPGPLKVRKAEVAR